MKNCVLIHHVKILIIHFVVVNVDVIVNVIVDVDVVVNVIVDVDVVVDVDVDMVVVVDVVVDVVVVVVVDVDMCDVIDVLHITHQNLSYKNYIIIHEDLICHESYMLVVDWVFLSINIILKTYNTINAL